RADRAHGGHPRRAARSRRPAAGLPLPSALPALPAREPRALHTPDDRPPGPARGGAGASGRVPPRRRQQHQMSATANELEVQSLTKYFPVGGSLVRRAKVHAVDDVSFVLQPGTITALVGESGSGKSTVARLLAKLYQPTDGRVVFDGRDLARTRRRRDLLR